MTTLENFYFGNINPSDYEVKTDVKKQLNLITKLTGELNETLSTEEQKEVFEQIITCQMSLIALSERDAFIKGYKLGTRMTTEVYLNQ